jgi:hypothetical protein
MKIITIVNIFYRTINRINLCDFFKLDTLLVKKIDILWFEINDPPQPYLL